MQGWGPGHDMELGVQVGGAVLQGMGQLWGLIFFSLRKPSFPNPCPISPWTFFSLTTWRSGAGAVARCCTLPQRWLPFSARHTREPGAPSQLQGVRAVPAELAGGHCPSRGLSPGGRATAVLCPPAGHG
ncbi:unnamed protein product [Lepidochelys kempii]